MGLYINNSLKAILVVAVFNNTISRGKVRTVEHFVFKPRYMYIF